MYFVVLVYERERERERELNDEMRRSSDRINSGLQSRCKNTGYRENTSSTPADEQHAMTLAASILRIVIATLTAVHKQALMDNSGISLSVSDVQDLSIETEIRESIVIHTRMLAQRHKHAQHQLISI